MITIPNALTQYTELRRTLGAKFKEQAQTLGQFVTFLKHEKTEFITTKLALRWATQPKLAQRATWERRLSMVRKFATWLSTIDPRTEIPPKRLLSGGPRRKKPYIFTEAEVNALMAEAGKLTSTTGLPALTYTTLIGLLSSTGLRPGEALALDISDVDLKAGVISVRESKFGKSRFVPIEESARLTLIDYVAKRNAICRGNTTDALFISRGDKRLRGDVARRTFAQISCAVGLRKPTGSKRIGRGPRLRDFRHTFATRRLIEWYRAGLDVARELPKLTTYLGHAEVGNTYWYIDAVPELLQLAIERLMARKQKGGDA